MKRCGVNTLACCSLATPEATQEDVASEDAEYAIRTLSGSF
jgi:hypothetical protein